MKTATERLIINVKTNSNKIAGILRSKFLWTCFFFFVIASNLLLAQSEKTTEGMKGNIVNYRWVEENLKNPNVIILDVSSGKIFDEKHIPGAMGVNTLKWYGINEIPIPEMEKICKTWGISTDKKIVIYDQGGSIMATRLFFALYYYGFPTENLFILDGGLTKWEEAGLQVTNEITEPRNNGTFKIKEVMEEGRVRLPETLIASGDTESKVLVEALEPGWHYGEVQMFSRAGHIPNSKMLPSGDFFNEDKTFKSAEEIKRMLDYLGINQEKQIYTYCGGGVAASVPFFVLKFILEYPQVRLYIESELGWLKDERELPFWTYDVPYLMRESNWLKTWGGKMLRMYFDPQISIIDVRPEIEYKKGHLPFAVNIPYEIFKININQPEKLAEVLSAAGIKTEDEAVIVSGKGLTKESALAFILMEKSGQKKVSVFMDTMDEWTQLGFSLIMDTTNTKSKKPGEYSKSTLNIYELNLRKDFVIEDYKDIQGLYPKVFIVSGDKIPLNVVDHKVIPLSYADVLNEDGTPKAAKDIWSIIDKAGIPRYAELVCISEKPEEAAVNYFILKLMGYPDIKVLLN